MIANFLFMLANELTDVNKHDPIVKSYSENHFQDQKSEKTECIEKTTSSNAKHEFIVMATIS